MTEKKEANPVGKVGSWSRKVIGKVGFVMETIGSGGVNILKRGLGESQEKKKTV